MATYRNVVALIDGWQTKTDAELIEAATAKDLPWADPEWWTSWGVAGCIGPENVTPLLERIRLTNFAWVADAISSGKAPFGDAKVNAMLLQSGDPDMIKIAQATRKLISICESQGLPNDGQRVVEAARQMRVEKRKEDKLRVDADRWNRHVKAVGQWDGDPATEPNL